MRVPDLFVSKLFTVNTLATGTIMVREVTTLCHESLDHSMEDALLISEIIALLHRTKLSEIFRRLLHRFRVNFKDNTTFFLLCIGCILVPNLNIHISLHILRIVSWQLIELFG